MRSLLAPSDDERRRGALDAATQARALADFDAHGYLFLRAVWPRELVARLRDDFVAHVEAGRAEGRSRGVAVGDRRLMVSVPIAGRFADAALLAHPLVHPLLAARLGDDFLLDSVGAVVALPGAAAQARHKDHDLICDAAVAVTLPPWAVTMVVPLVDLDATTGTTALVPGSHRRDQIVDGEAVEHPVAAMGDGYLMDYRLSHWGTANPGARSRPILYIVYARPWFTDARNFQKLRALDVPGAAWSSLAVEVRRLLARATNII